MKERKNMKKYYICPHCGNIVTKLEDSGVPVVCCGSPMKELVPNTTDAAQEKHVPVVSVDGNVVTVEVGSVAHPMTEAHSIRWIALETEKGVQVQHLTPEDAPKAVFLLREGEKVVRVLEYCNLHGLWMA